MIVKIVLVSLVGYVFGAAVPADQPNSKANFFSPPDGIVPIKEVGIVGGDPTTIEQFPWIVSIQYNNSHRCGASIISPNRFLTAAHCTIGYPASDFQLRVRSANNQAGGQLVQVSKIINHPEYSPETIDNDIAVMWIDRLLNTTLPGISVIRLPAQDEGVVTGFMGNVAGWGNLCYKCYPSNILRFTSIPFITNAQCTDKYVGRITEGMLCAGFPGGNHGPCQGDSGGPFTICGTLVGVVSWGFGCANPGLPAVFARVAFYRNWIDSNI